MSKITRRTFLGLTALAAPAALGIDARLIEPTNVRVSELKRGTSGCRFVHFTDFHHKGNVRYAQEIVRTINELNSQFVCFTGDLVENKTFQDEALSFIREIKVPVYGSPGNHDYWSGANFAAYQSAFSATGGEWLVDRSVVLPEHDLELVGMGMIGIHAPAFKDRQAGRRVLLMHYPLMADSLGARFDLVLAGHSHGGQIRIPFYGAIAVPWGVGRYDLGLFDTPGGPLYVNAGIGTYRIPYRFNCRPEITVVTI